MKKLICLTAAFSLAVPYLAASYALPTVSAAAQVHDYTKETQVNQFRPHSGDRAEIDAFFAGLITMRTNASEIDKLLAPDSAGKEEMKAYLAGWTQYKDIKIVETKVEKLYTASDYDAYSKFRAIVKCKYLGFTHDNKVIEKTDYIGLAKLGKETTDWKLWGVVWKDSGIDVSDVELFQLEKPRKGEEICVMTTEAGVIKMRLFPDKAPKTVKNFKELALQGHYNNVAFHRVINDFMIQGGALDGSGEEDFSIYGGFFEDEFNRDLFNFRGALAMGNAGPNTNGNQFYIVQSPKVDQEYLDLSALPLNAEAKYKEIGGRAYLDNRHTVFGQVFEGMEAVDKIAAQKTDDNAKPLQNAIKILKIEFVKYE